MIDCPACDGSGSDPLSTTAATHPCNRCGGTGRREPDFAIPMFLSVGWNTRVPRTVTYSIDSTKEKSEALRMTLDHARENVARVKAGKHFHNLEPNSIVRVYLK